MQADRFAEQLREKKDEIKSKIENLAVLDDDAFKEGLEKFALEAPQGDAGFPALVDEYLLETLEQKDAPNREKLIAVARCMDFPSQCLNQIRSRKEGIIALGSRRAGLYQFREAVDDMINALDFLSPGDQAEILMGIARIGDTDAMQKALEKIRDHIIVNERAFIGILDTLPDGKNKKKLFRNMIKSDTPYIAALFLKAMSRETAKSLSADIVSILHEGNKEVRIAAVHALSSLDKNAPAEELIAALDDKAWEVRAVAAKALGPVMVPEASYALFKALCDSQWWVRQNAANSLIDHPNYEALFILAAETGDEYTKDSIIAALEDGRNPLLLKSIKIMAARIAG